jgi:aryl-alcohol dehydrogenase-like predicted oxidoreductase
MKYRTLGRTGIVVSPYCLGAMMFGTMGNPDHDDSIRIIHRALDAGINFIDTADVYSRGESEVIVGKALKGRRDGVVLASKVHYPMGDDPNHRGNSRRWIIAAVENSLRRLQTDHLDLYQVHRPDPTVDVEETLSALSDLIHSGKVRAIGTSTFPASEIVEAQWVAERRVLERFRTEQPPYSIINRSVEREVLPVCQRYGMGTLVWSPLGQGLLTGRYRRGKQAGTHRSGGMPQHFSDERKLGVVEQLIPLADKAGLPMTHLAMAFASPTRASPRRSSGRGLWNSSMTCSPAPTSPWTTRFSTGSTRSLRPGLTPAPTTWPTHRRPSRPRACAAGRSPNAPPSENR